MKRIQSACIQKTLHFQLKEDLGHAAAAEEVKKEVERYKAQLDRSKTRYKILDECTQPDDSIIIKVKMQYNNVPCGEYLD